MSISAFGGIIAAGSYVPVHRLSRATFAGPAARGARAVAGYDEDTTTMGVEAARRALADAGGSPPAHVFFATTFPAYADKTNATAIHAALGLPRSSSAYDMVGSVRSGVGALHSAACSVRPGASALVVCSDIRTGLPGSADERAGGDGAAALLWGSEGPFLAELVGRATATAEFMDRWRVPGENHSHLWEERFGEVAYRPVADEALADGLKNAGVALSDVDHLIITGPHTRAVASTARRSGVDSKALADDLSADVGFTGAAHAAMTLVDVLARARPGQLIVLLNLADGADCLVFRGGALLAERRPSSHRAGQLGGRPVAYRDYLVWRGMLQREPPRRPDPDRPAAPPSSRNTAWKFGFVAGRCASCGTRHLPPSRVCQHCHAHHRMHPETLSGLRGTVTTFAVDHLAFTVAPPMVAAVIDFDGGGRLQCEITDCDPGSVSVGDRVEPTFRRFHTTADGVHNYFWKVRPLLSREA